MRFMSGLERGRGVGGGGEKEGRGRGYVACNDRLNLKYSVFTRRSRLLLLDELMSELYESIMALEATHTGHNERQPLNTWHTYHSLPFPRLPHTRAIQDCSYNYAYTEYK